MMEVFLFEEKTPPQMLHSGFSKIFITASLQNSFEQLSIWIHAVIALRITQKALQLPFLLVFFLLLFPLVAVSGWTGKSFFL